MASPERVVVHVMPWGAIGGTELATLRIAQAVASSGYRSVMLCRTDAPVVAEFFGSHGFQTEPYDVTRFERSGPAGRAAWMVRLARTLRRLRARIVHCADVAAGDYAALPAKLARARLVCHVRNRYDWLTRYQRAWLLLVDRLVGVSRHTLAQFGCKARQPIRFADRVGTVVYDGLDIGRGEAADLAALRREFGIEPDERIVGMVARIALQKDHLTLIEAAEQVVRQFPRVRFVFIGGCGPEAHELQHGERVAQRIAQGSAPDRFVLAGFRSDVARLLQLLDVFVLCTHYEGLPLVLIEAMAQGKPVVATAVDGIPELIEDGRTGLLHRHRDVEQLAAQLLRLLQSPEQAAAMGEAGRQRVSERFSAERFGADMVGLYDRLLR